MYEIQKALAEQEIRMVYRAGHGAHGQLGIGREFSYLNALTVASVGTLDELLQNGVWSDRPALRSYMRALKTVVQ